MKVGDNVWCFCSGAQKIKEVIILSIIEYANGVVWITTELECGILNRDIFPTREALCEHYRKIFE